MDLRFRKSKADQAGRFMTHSLRIGGASALSHATNVEAREMLRSWHPARFGTGPEAGPPLFRGASGVVLHRTQGQQPLREAAAAGGGPELEVVKQYGRCQSGALHRCLWNAAEQSRGAAEGMAAVEATIHYT